jgi:hypothetical protein
MPGKRFKTEEIVNKLRQADVELARGSTVAAVAGSQKIPRSTSFRIVLSKLRSAEEPVPELA